MARSRSLPKEFLLDPDVMELTSADHRLILIGLVLNADDEGRGLAHCKVLACVLGSDYSPTQIEQALLDLQAHELVQIYQVSRHRYYHLPRWLEWETLSKPTPSKYPAPPCVEVTCKPSPGFSQNPQGNLALPREALREDEEERNRREEEAEDEQKGETHPPNVLPFPTARPDDDGSDAEQTITETTRLVARILKLSETDELRRIVQDYQQHEHISLLGEADAAREWIQDRQRNRNGRRMTPAFFRNWLKREQRSSQEAERRRATGTDGTGPSPGSPATPLSPGARKPPSLMNLEARYKSDMQQGRGEHS